VEYSKLAVPNESLALYFLVSPQNLHHHYPPFLPFTFQKIYLQPLVLLETTILNQPLLWGWALPQLLERGMLSQSCEEFDLLIGIM
jgi:hypothetical protein